MGTPSRVIEVVDYDERWPGMFARERERLRDGLRAAGAERDVLAIEHVGSTAVPGLAAKPVIDILIGLRTWPTSTAVITALEGLGYVHRGEAGIVGRDYFQDAPPGSPRTRQVHAVEHGSRFWTDHLLFRDHLRADRADRTRYAEHKRRLARAHRHSSLEYWEAKREVLREILGRAWVAAGADPVHAAASSGFATDPERYERARPGYPDEALAWLAAQLGLGPRRSVADVGAGTGKLTAGLVATGADVVAVEPVAAMREYLSRSLPDVDVRAGTAEEMPLPTGCLDALVAGQAFHWFDATDALSEAYRTLREGCSLGLVWNVRDQSVGWVRRWTEIVDRVADGAPRERESPWRRVVDATRLFARTGTRTFPNPQALPRQAVLERVASTSFVAALDDGARQAVLDEVRAVLDSDPETRNRARITVPYRTEVHVVTRIP